MALDSIKKQKLLDLINQAEANGESPEFIQSELIPKFKAIHDTTAEPQQQQPSQEQQLQRPDPSKIITEPVKSYIKTASERVESVGKPTWAGGALRLEPGTIEEKIVGIPERMARERIGAAANLVDIPAIAGGAALRAADFATGGRAGRAISGALEKTGVSKTLADIGAKYESFKNELSPASQANLTLAESAATTLGGIGGIGVGKGVVAKSALGAAEKSAVRSAESQIGKAAKEIVPNEPRSIADIKYSDIKNQRVGEVQQGTGTAADISKIKGKPGLPFLKDLSESEARLMKEPKAPNGISFTDYAKQAEIAKKDVRAITPMQLAAKNATDAFKDLDAKRKIAGDKISELVKKNADKKIDISDAKNRFLTLVDERIGGLKSGEIMADPSASKAIEDIGNTLLNLGDNIDPKTAVTLKQNLRSKLKYDAAGQLRPPNKVMDGILKDVSGLIDNKLDNAITGFSDANATYGKIKRVEDAMSRALGQEFVPGSGLTKHGASIMKRATQSNADSNIGDIFREVKDITGGKYDLFQDAQYSNIAMRLSGDQRQQIMAAPFGQVVGGNITGAAANVGKAIVGEGKNERVIKWYEKEQAKHKKPTEQQKKNLITDESGAVDLRLLGVPKQKTKLNYTTLKELTPVDKVGIKYGTATKSKKENK